MANNVDQTLNEALNDKNVDLSRAVNHLKSRQALDALVLLRSSLCAPRLVFYYASSHSHPALLELNRNLRSKA